VEGGGVVPVVVPSTIAICTGSLVVNTLNLPNRFVSTPGVVTLAEVLNDAVDDDEVDDAVLVTVTVVVTASVVVVKTLSGTVVARVLAAVKLFPRPLTILEPLLLGSEYPGAPAAVDELAGVTGDAVVVDLDLVVSGSRVEVGMVWVTGWSTVVVNTPLPKLLRPRCLPKLLRLNLGDIAGWNLVLDGKELN